MARYAYVNGRYVDHREASVQRLEERLLEGHCGVEVTSGTSRKEVRIGARMILEHDAERG